MIRSGLARQTAAQTTQAARKLQIQILSFFDPEYPQMMKEIFDPPLILYFRGNVDLLLRPPVAIVGSRRCSAYGKEMTQKLARELAIVGLNVVSGLAQGIDSQARRYDRGRAGVELGVAGTGDERAHPAVAGATF